jgi:prepilin-type N-terminal cleavage/methylation domain-containing protein
MSRLRARSERGFSLVETLAALVVFSLVTLGIVPVLLTSIRGSNISRSYTVGKNVALEAMERVRGLPFYIDAATQPRPVDVLDLYLPNLTAYNTSSCTGFFTTAVSCAATNYQVRSTPTVEAPGYLTTCTDAQPRLSYCPTGIADDYSVTYQTWFIQEETATDTDPETYNRVPLCASGIVTACVPTNYNASISGRDLPAKLLIEMIITVRWTSQGRDRSYDLRTVMGDRTFGDTKVKAEATIEYTINGVAGYQDPSAGGNRSEVNATAGYSQSRIASERTSTADTTIRAAEARLVNANTTPDPCSLAPPGCPGHDVVPPVSGATSTLLAPTDVTGTAITRSFFSISHPQASIGAVAGADTTHIAAHNALTSPHQAVVAGGEPKAGGNFAFLNGPNPHFWVDNNREDTNAFDFQSGGNIRLFSVNPRGSNNITGTTSAVTNTIGSGVTSTASTAANDIRLFPTQTIRARNSTFNGAVVVIENFTATVTCQARTDGVTTTPTASYSATLHYWFDPNENDISDGSYQTVNLSLGGGADPLQTIRTAAMATSGQGSLVIDTNNDTRDVYLFPRFNNREYYLENWSSARTTVPVVASQGRQVSVALEAAITLETTDIQRGSSGGQVAGTSFGISVGSLSCSAEDRR